MQKQFLTTLLHESLAQEDHAVDQFEGPYYSSSSASSISTTSPHSLSASGPSSAASSPSLTFTPESPVPSAGKVLLIVPGAGTTTGVNVSVTQPLDFAQVFGKLSSTTPTTTTLINSAIVNEFLQGKATIQSITEDQVRKQVAEHQQLAFDSNIIKIDPGIHNKSQVDIENELTNDVENFNLAYSLKPDPHSNSVGEIEASHNNPTPTPTTSAFSVATADYNKLKDILIENSREALELEGSLSNRTHKSVSDGENIANVTTTAATKASQVDPMVILSQAVNLQKVVINFTANFLMHT